MSEPYVAIVKTVADEPLWPGLPDNYPVVVTEHASREAALLAHPEAHGIMPLIEYRAYAKEFHDKYPTPKAWKDRGKQLAAKRPWWKFWGAK